MSISVKIKTSKKFLIIGFGYRTGLATANYLARHGLEVAVSDTKNEKLLTELIEKLDKRVTLYAGCQDISLLEKGFDIIVLSPGVPAAIELVKTAIKRNILVISEVELAYAFMQGAWIAITGTDGKSTTTSLVNYILKKLGLDSREGGNIGIPLISLVNDSSKKSITVAELSSFQLESVHEFCPDVAAILNISPDHLDRYENMDTYFDAKMRMVKNQKNNDYFIYNADDPRIANAAQNVSVPVRSFSLQDKSADAFYNGGAIYLNNGNAASMIIDTAKLKIIGLHNVQNVMCAVLIVKSLSDKLGFNFKFEDIAAACYSFKGLEHRMEDAGSYAERFFINDSKATTVGAVEMALKSLKTSTVLILGGKAKGDDYSRLIESIDKNIRAIVLIGETAKEFSEIFKSFDPVSAANMDDALRISMQLSVKGDTILLSPACASFDMYKNFEERGRAFKESINKLQQGVL